MPTELLELEGDQVQGLHPADRSVVTGLRDVLLFSGFRLVDGFGQQRHVFGSSFDAVERSLPAPWRGLLVFQRVQLVTDDRLPLGATLDGRIVARTARESTTHLLQVVDLEIHTFQGRLDGSARIADDRCLMRRLRPWALGVLVLLAAAFAFRGLASWIEGRITARVQREAARDSTTRAAAPIPRRTKDFIPASSI